MSLSLDDIHFLSGEAGCEALLRFADADISPGNGLRLLLEMRKSLSQSQAAAVLTTLRLRQRAGSKFPRHAQVMLFTDRALQQASDPRIRRYRASVLRAEPILDVCCGIGSDSIAFAYNGRPTLGIDIDPIQIAIARHNAGSAGVSADFRVHDAREALPAGFAAIFFDPSRRDANGRRISHVERYQPPLSTALDWRAEQILVKLSPAVDMRQLSRYGGQVEFISVNRQLKEAQLWLHRPSASPLATLLDDSGIHHLSSRANIAIAASKPKAWLFEPDPAIIRAAAVQTLGADLDASLLDETIAYLTLDQRVATPWGRYFRVLDWMPFNLKRLRQYLNARGVGHVTIKKRGFPMLPEELIARLRLRRGGESRILFATRCQGKRVIIICAA